MSNWKKYIPEGTRDILFDECTKKVEIENKLRKIYLSRGYSEVISPTLEFYDVFNLENQPIEQEKMYKLFDNSGRIMVLRPDMTTPIARIVSTKIKNNIYPLKLCYTSNIFRVNEDLNGKLSEITQSGIEIIGSESIKADAELVITAIKALKATGLENFKIEVGQAQFFKAIMEDILVCAEDEEKIRKFIENKNFAVLKEFLSNQGDNIAASKVKILEQMPTLFGNSDVLNKAKKLTENKNALKAIENIENLYEIIKIAGFEEYLTIDLGMVQHINYYTGLIFKGYTAGVGDDILAGGRYDTLTAQFGNDKHSTGFAINVDSIMIALEKQNKNVKEHQDHYVVYSEKNKMKEALEALEVMERENKVAELSLFDNLEETKRYVEENNKILVEIK